MTVVGECKHNATEGASFRNTHETKLSGLENHNSDASLERAYTYFYATKGEYSIVDDGRNLSGKRTEKGD